MAIGFVVFSNYARLFGVSAIIIAMAACSDSGENSGSSQTEATQAPDVELPPNWFPESINAGRDGTIYVGSFASAQIAAFQPGDRKATVLVGPGTAKNMSDASSGTGRASLAA
jgi:hypothetical protein